MRANRTSTLSSCLRYASLGRISSIALTHHLQQHPARDLQDTFYVSDPPKAGRPGPASADDKQDYEEYFQNVKQVHETGKYGSIGYRYPWSEDESLKYVAVPPCLTAVTDLGQDWCCGRTRLLSRQPCCKSWPDNARMDASRPLGTSPLTEFSGKMAPLHQISSGAHIWLETRR